MNEVREGSSVADEVLHDRLIALADEVVQECARIELAQELDILFGQIAIRENDIDVVAQCRSIKIIKIVTQGMRPCFEQRLRIESAALLEYAREHIEEF